MLPVILLALIALFGAYKWFKWYLIAGGIVLYYVGEKEQGLPSEEDLKKYIKKYGMYALTKKRR